MSIFHHVGVVLANIDRCLRTTYVLYAWQPVFVCHPRGTRGLDPRAATPNIHHDPSGRRDLATARTRTSGVWLAVVAILVAVAAGGGCRPASSDPQGPSSNAAVGDSMPGTEAGDRTAPENLPASRLESAARKPSTDAAAPLSPVHEIWEVSRIEGRKVGHARTRRERVIDEQGETLERIEMEQVVALARFGQQLRQTLRLVSWERPAGGLVRFESQVSSGGEWTLTRGQVSDGLLAIESATPGKTERQSLPWNEQLGGFFAVERLLSQPWSPGEKRSVQAIVPLLNQIGKTELQDAGVEALRIEGHSRSLRKIRRVDTVGAIKLESTHWVDEQGETVRSVSTFPPPGMETVRTDRATALAEETADAAFDLGAATRIPVANMPADPHGCREIVYLAELTHGSIEGVFPSGASQSVRKLDEQRAEVRVRAIRPAKLADGTPSDVRPPSSDGQPMEAAPTDDERVANGLVQSDDATVVALAKSVAADESDAWRVAIALEALVRRHVQPKQFSQAMATAAEVARSGEGDCTEHAVLLAALCRSRGLAARVAIGLVYAESLGGFAYHMWNEVWIDGQWIPLDATLARQGIGAGHLKLASSSLRGTDAFAALLPVVNVLGRLKLSVAQPSP